MESGDRTAAMGSFFVVTSQATVMAVPKIAICHPQSYHRQISQAVYEVVIAYNYCLSVFCVVDYHPPQLDQQNETCGDCLALENGRVNFRSLATINQEIEPVYPHLATKNLVCSLNFLKNCVHCGNSVAWSETDVS